MSDGATLSPSRDEAHRHLVQLYRDDDEIASSVAIYLGDALAGGEPAVVLATEAHRAQFVQLLDERGLDTVRLQETGLLFLLDAETTLSEILDVGVPSAARFEEIIGQRLERASAAAGGAPVSAYGEMVDLLWHRGDPAGALALEGLWNDLLTRVSFSLLCGYRIDLFDRTAQVTFLPQVCRAHSRVVPGRDGQRIERAVDAALIATLGRPDAEKIYTLVSAQVRDEEVPPAQLALMWVSAHMPRTAERVLAAARAHYGSAAPV